MENNKDNGELSAKELAPDSLAYELAKSKESENLLGDIRKQTQATLRVLKNWKLEDISRLELNLNKDSERFSKLRETIGTQKKKPIPKGEGEPGANKPQEKRPQEKRPEEKKPQEKRPEEKKPQEKRPSPEQDAKRKADFEKKRSTRYRQLRDRGVPADEARRRAYDDTVRAQKPKDRLKIIRKSGDPYNRERIYQSQYNALVRRGYTGWDAIEGATRSTAIIQRIKLLEEKNKLQNEIKTPKPTGGFKLPELPKLELPKLNLPKPQLPKLNLPKPQLPKVNLPKPQLPKLKLPELNENQLKRQGFLNKLVGKIFDVKDVFDLGTSAAKRDIGGVLSSGAGLLSNFKKFSPLAYFDAYRKLYEKDVAGAAESAAITRASGSLISRGTGLLARVPALSNLAKAGPYAAAIGGGLLVGSELVKLRKEQDRKEKERIQRQIEALEKAKRGETKMVYPTEFKQGPRNWWESLFPPRMAEGGVVTKPTLALIGEGNEEEYIVPQSKLASFVSSQSNSSVNDDFNKPARIILGVANNFVSQFGSASGDVRRMVGSDILRLERIFGKEKFVLPIFVKGEGSFDNIIGDVFSRLTKFGGSTGGVIPELYDAVDNLLFTLDEFLAEAETMGAGGGELGGGEMGGGEMGGGDISGVGEIDYSNLKGGDISSTAGKVKTLYDEFRSIGYTDEAAKRVIAEIGREGSFVNKNLFGTHTDPKAGITNQGMISWNQVRRNRLLAAARSAGVLDTSGNLKPTAESLRFQARFLATEVKGYSGELDKLLRTEGSSGARISQLLRDKYIVYDPSYAGGKDPEYGSAQTKKYYQMIAPGLNQSRLISTPSTQPRTQQSQPNIIAQIYGTQLTQQQRPARNLPQLQLEIHADAPGGRSGLIESLLDDTNNQLFRLLRAEYGPFPRGYRDLGGPKRGLSILELLAFNDNETRQMQNRSTRAAFVDRHARRLFNVLRKYNGPVNLWAGHADLTTGETGTSGTISRSIEGKTTEQLFNIMVAQRVAQLARASGRNNITYTPSIIANAASDPNNNWLRAQRMRGNAPSPSGQQSSASYQQSSLSSNQRVPSGLIMPARGPLTSPYGWRWNRMHKGIDIGGPIGAPIVAPESGKVVYAAFNDGGFGNLVIIQGSKGYHHLAHLDKILTRVGARVSANQLVGKLGTTGRSTGPHLHWEVRTAIMSGGHTNPLELFPSRAPGAPSPADTSSVDMSSTQTPSSSSQLSGNAPVRASAARAEISRLRRRIPGLNGVPRRRPNRVSALQAPTSLSTTVAVQPVIIQQPVPTQQTASSENVQRTAPRISTNWTPIVVTG